MADTPKRTKQSADKLGEYLVTGDIAEGTFGKVKSERFGLEAFPIDQN